MPKHARWHDLAAVLLLLLLPAALLGECVFGGKKYLPYDLAEFPPVATTLDAVQLAALRTDCNYDATEPPVWFVPEMRLARAALQHGEYPHWNAYVRGGAPLTAHGHMGFLDPLHWPALLFADPADGLLYLTWLMFALAGTLMYGLLRSLQLETAPAMFGAVAFELSGTLLANGHWFQRMEPLALLPGLLWAAIALARAEGRRRALPAVLFAVPFALCWTAGFPPFCLPVALLAVLLALVLVGRKAGARGPRGAVVLGGWFALAILLGFLFAAPQVLQQVYFFPESNRPPNPGPGAIGKHAFDPFGLLGYVFPESIAHPGDRTLPADRNIFCWSWSRLVDWESGAPLRPNWNFTEYALFPGTLVLLSAVLGLCARGPRWRFLCAIAIGGCFTLAIAPEFARVAYRLPGIQAVPPMRFVGPTCAFVAMLAACGLQALQRSRSPWLLRSVGVLALAAAGALLVRAMAAGPKADAADPTIMAIAARYEPLAPGQLTPQLIVDRYLTQKQPDGSTVDYVARAQERLHHNLLRAGAALGIAAAFLLWLSFRARDSNARGWPAAVCILLTATELLAFGLPLNHGRALPCQLDGPVHAFLRAERDRYGTTGGFMVARANPGAGEAWHLPPGTLAQERIRDLHMYTFVDRGSGELLRSLYGSDFLIRDYMPQALPDDERLELPVWDAMGLRFLFATQPMQHAGRQVGPHLRGAEPEQQFLVYERPNALPRAWVVPVLHEVTDEKGAVAAMTAKEFAPRARAIVTAADRALLGNPPAGGADAAQRDVQFLFENSRRLTLQVPAGGPGHLVLADSFFSGWSVEVNGRPAPMARANVCQRVVPLPAEACRVEFRFATPGLRTGLVLAGVGALLALVLVVIWLRAGRRTVTAEPLVPDPPGGAVDGAPA